MRVPCWAGEYIASFEVTGADNYRFEVPEKVCAAVKKVQVRQISTKPALIVVSKVEIKIYCMESLNEECVSHGLKHVCYVAALPRSSHLAFVACEPTVGCLPRYCHVFNLPSRTEAQEVRQAIYEGMHLESGPREDSPMHTGSSGGSSLERPPPYSASPQDEREIKSIHDALRNMNLSEVPRSRIKTMSASPQSPRRRLSLLAEEITPPSEPPPTPPTPPVVMRQNRGTKNRRERKRFSLPPDRVLQRAGPGPIMTSSPKMQHRPMSGIYGESEPQSPPAQITRLNDGTELILKHGLIRFNKPPGAGGSPSPQRSVPKMGVTAKRRPMSTFVSTDQLNYSQDGTKPASGWTHLTPAASEQQFGTLDESIPSDPLNSSNRSDSPPYWQRPQSARLHPQLHSSASVGFNLERKPSRRSSNFFKKLLWKSSHSTTKLDSSLVSNNQRTQSQVLQNNPNPGFYEGLPTVRKFTPPPPEPVKMRDKSKRGQRPHSEAAKQKRSSFGGINISFGRVLGNRLRSRALDDSDPNNNQTPAFQSFNPEETETILPVPETEDKFLSEAPWFCAHAPRELVSKLLADEPPGTFLVRRSSTQQGCYALTVRFGPGLANFLIYRTYRGYKFKGFDKDFPSVHSLITHHTIMAERLPTRLEFSRRVAQWIHDFRALQMRAEGRNQPREPSYSANVLIRNGL